MTPNPRSCTMGAGDWRIWKFALRPWRLRPAAVMCVFMNKLACQLELPEEELNSSTLSPDPEGGMLPL